MRTTLRLVPAMFATLLAVPLAGCGDDDGTVDRANPESVFAGALRAVAARDLGALLPLLTPDGRRGLERTFREWQAALRDPVKGPFVLDRMRERGVLPDADALDLARFGAMEDAWDLFLRTEPRSASPPRGETRKARDGNSAILLYENPGGTMLPVRLVRLADGWYVDDLQL